MNIAQQTLYYQGPNHSSVEKDYVLSDEAGLFICFDTAQQAADWIRVHSPGVATHYQIDKRPNTMTEGEIKFTPMSHISSFHQRCGKCGRVFSDYSRKYYPCPEHPSV